MKKAIKIFSILCAILVAVFTATFFNSNFKVSADDEIYKSFYYEDLEIRFDYYEDEATLNLFYNVGQEIITNSVDYDQDITIKINNTLTLNYENLNLDDSNPYTNDTWLVTYIINETINIEEIEKIEIVNLTFSIFNENSEDNVIYYKKIENLELPITLIRDIFTETTSLLTKIVNFFVTAISTIISLFWVSGTGLTIYGKLFLIPAGFSVFYKVMKWVGRLIRIR